MSTSFLSDPGDRVVYGPRNTTLTEDTNVYIQGGRKLNFIGTVQMNGTPVGSGGAPVTYSGTSVTGVLADGGAYLRFTGASPTYTVPTNAAVAYPVGTRIDGIGVSSTMTLAAAGGVTINKSRTLVTSAAKSGWTLIKVGTDEWDLHGDLA